MSSLPILYMVDTILISSKVIIGGIYGRSFLTGKWLGGRGGGGVVTQLWTEPYGAMNVLR